MSSPVHETPQLTFVVDATAAAAAAGNNGRTGGLATWNKIQTQWTMIYKETATSQIPMLQQ